MIRWEAMKSSILSIQFYSSTEKQRHNFCGAENEFRFRRVIWGTCGANRLKCLIGSWSEAQEKGIGAGNLKPRLISIGRMLELVRNEDCRRRKGEPRAEPSGAPAFHEQRKGGTLCQGMKGAEGHQKAQKPEAEEADPAAKPRSTAISVNTEASVTWRRGREARKDKWSHSWLCHNVCDREGCREWNINILKLGHFRHQLVGATCSPSAAVSQWDWGHESWVRSRSNSSASQAPGTMVNAGKNWVLSEFFL